MFLFFHHTYEEWSQKQIGTKKLLYHGVAAIIGQDDDINRCRVIGYADAAIFWFVLSRIEGQLVRKNGNGTSVLIFHVKCHILPVVISDDSSKGPDTDAITQQMDLLTQEGP